MENKVTIKIPRPLYVQLRKMIKDTGFSSVNGFIVFVMRNLVSASGFETEEKLATSEVTAILGRLKKLGYLKEK
jgi:hypothetical protein